MAAKSVTCAGCLKTIDSKNKLKCSTCNSTYDLICANVTEKRFYSFYGASSEQPKEWTCSKCISKRPKGDNSNTPIRMDKESSHDESQSTNNVTQRSKPRLVNTLLGNIDLISTIRDEIRAAIRAELAPVKEQLGELKDSVYK